MTVIEFLRAQNKTVVLFCKRFFIILLSIAFWFLPQFLLSGEARSMSSSGSEKNEFAFGKSQTSRLPSYLLLFQIEQRPIAAEDSQSTPNSLQCMRARARLRLFGGISTALALFLSIIIYTLWLWILPRSSPSLLKWAISPFLGSLIVAALFTYIENEQLINNCGEISSFRLDTFSKTFLINGLIATFILFSVAALARFIWLKSRFERLRSS